MILYLVPEIIFNWWKIVVYGTLGFKFASMSYILQKKQSKEIFQRQESDIIKIKDQILDKIFHFPEMVCPHETGDHFFVWELETM